MTSNERVSCLVVVFNGAEFLAECLESVLAQTRPPDEIILVDDGSTDATGAVAQQFPAVRYSYQPNQGVGAARNAALSLATGSLIAFNDADDCWLPEKIERQLSRFVQRPELDICGCHMEHFWLDETRRREDLEYDAKLQFPQPCWTFQGLLIRRVLFSRVGHVDPSLRYGEDTEWFIRAQDAGAVREMHPETLVRRRIHNANLSRVYRRESRELLTGFFKESIDRRRQVRNAD